MKGMDPQGRGWGRAEVHLYQHCLHCQTTSAAFEASEYRPREIVGTQSKLFSLAGVGLSMEMLSEAGGHGHDP